MCLDSLSGAIWTQVCDFRVVAVGYQATGAFAKEIFCVLIAHLSSEDVTAHSIRVHVR